MTHVQAKKVETETALPNESETKTREPTWFTNDQKTLTADEMAEHYRTNRFIETPGPEAYEDYRRSMNDRFEVGKRIYDTGLNAELRPTLPLSDLHGRRKLHQQAQRPTPSHSKQTTPWFKIIGLSSLAIIIGGAGGYGFANRDILTTKLFENVKPVQLANIMPHETIVEKKNISMASLEVNDVRGTLNSMIPLMLSTQGSEEIGLKISGLPDAAYLTAGKANEKGDWLLQPADIAGVKIVVPRLETNQFAMEVAAIETTTGNLAAPIKEMKVRVDQPQISDKSQLNIAATIAPVSAAPDNAAQLIPQAIGQAPSASANLISKADALLNTGDVASARQYYLQAHELGDINGAYGVGRSYDPQIFSLLHVDGLKPDKAKAAEWYGIAAKAGNMAAKTALSSLQ
jgi:hypothetical protein